MASAALKQMLNFNVCINRVEPERWVKICSKEIKRGVENNKVTDWKIREFVNGLREE